MLMSIFSAVETENLEKLATLFHQVDCRSYLIQFIEGQTPLHAAISKGSLLVADILIKEFLKLSLDLNIKDKQGWTPLVKN